MVKVNIPKSNSDIFYRYKRDEIEIRIININGGNTELSNLKTIADNIGDNIDLIIKYIKKKINTNIVTKNNKYIINKIQTKNSLEEIIEDYINDFVLCKICGNPEFNIIINKKEEIRTCKACGATRTY